MLPVKKIDNLFFSVTFFRQKKFFQVSLSLKVASLLIKTYRYFFTIKSGVIFLSSVAHDKLESLCSTVRDWVLDFYPESLCIY